MTRLPAKAASALAWSRRKVFGPIWKDFCMVRKTKKIFGMNPTAGCLRPAPEASEQKFFRTYLPVVNTTGCGLGRLRPQPIGYLRLAVNRFLKFFCYILRLFFACAANPGPLH